MNIDLNDPSSWPDNNAELLALANATGDPEAEPELDVPTATDAPKDAGPAAAAEPPKDADPAAAAAVAPKAEAAEDPYIVAADGKHRIPYTVLKETRDALAAAEAERDAALAAAKAASASAPATAQPSAEPAPNDAVPADVQARLDKLKENWGDEIYEQALLTYRLQQQTVRQEQEITRLRQHLDDQKQAQVRDEQAQIDEAMAATPQLVEWAKAADRTWFDRSVEVHKTLMATDQAYARAGWFDRFAALPGRTQALYGVAPSAGQQNAAPAAAAPPAAIKKVTDALAAVPRSLTEMGGGLPPERSEVEKLDELKGAALQSRLNTLAKDPKAFEKYLLAIS